MHFQQQHNDRREQQSMLSLVYRSGFFRNIKTKARTSIAGPTDEILRAKCAPFQFNRPTLSESSQTIIDELSDPILKLNHMISQQRGTTIKQERLTKDELKLILKHVKQILSEEDLVALAQLVRTVNQGEDTLGLCAPQIHIAKRLFIGCHEMTFSEDRSSVESHSLEAYFNPEIIDKSDKMCREAEGCLSFPGTFVIKSRAEQIRVKYHNILGEVVTHDLEGFPARIFQHELDHLEGIVMHDYVKSDPGDAIPFTVQNMYDFVDENGCVLEKYK